ncbi:hypothetical protein B0H63DRAFT_240955 [Podospora didyma]|uniref:Uncharacterized protein n=1 Tax=Podospora didyma TaxID=330526 RepID=A0AAE0KLC8_9PEZI|nr:hypothetical protein B0H63DRAFT_240955 [Podospora didyma]
MFAMRCTIRWTVKKGLGSSHRAAACCRASSHHTDLALGATQTNPPVEEICIYFLDSVRAPKLSSNWALAATCTGKEIREGSPRAALQQVESMKWRLGEAGINVQYGQINKHASSHLLFLLPSPRTTPALSPPLALFAPRHTILGKSRPSPFYFSAYCIFYPISSVFVSVSPHPLSSPSCLLLSAGNEAACFLATTFLGFLCCFPWAHSWARSWARCLVRWLSISFPPAAPDPPDFPVLPSRNGTIADAGGAANWALKYGLMRKERLSKQRAHAAARF